jgi:GWxTD domain-containing protein
MMKIPYSVFLMLLALGALFIAGNAETDKFDRWLKEEVSLLLDKQEKEEFRRLQSPEDKEKFIAQFWARRDPNPETDANEFKDEWFKRLDYVNKTFTRGLKKGWRSDMGKVYLFFGKPWQTKATPPSKKPQPSGGSQLDLGLQIWVYKQKPELRLNEIFEVTFIDQQWGYDLADQTPLIIRRALDVYPKTVIVNPDAKD